MKTFCLIACFLSVVWNGVGAEFPTLNNSGAFTFKALAMQQGLDDVVVNSKAINTANGTTFTTVTKSTVTNLFIEGGDLLAMLENSFATNFPAGSKLIVTRHGDFLFQWIVDATGTNIIFDVSTVFGFPEFTGAEVHADSQTLISKSAGAGPVSGALAQTVTQLMSVHYNDAALTTKDGTHTAFNVTCLLVRKTSENLATQHVKDSVKIQGFGSGRVRDQSVVLQINASATISGVVDPQ